LGLKPRPAPVAASAGTERPGLPVRRIAASILRQVIERGVPLDALLDEGRRDPSLLALDSRDRTLLRAIVGVALRRRGEIERALECALDRPLPQDSGALLAILHVGAAQILFLDIPDHAAVDLAVAQAAEGRHTRNARGLVNGVLRRIARERTTILAAGDVGSLNTPGWLFDRWRDHYGPTAAGAIAAAHLSPPGLDISVRADAEAWADRLGGVLLPTGTIRRPGTHRVTDLPGFAEGAWWVQDAAAALPARLLGNVAGRSIADLCAAPGGKTAQLAAAGADVTAIDISEKRLARVGENLARLRLPAKLVAADILDWRPEREFDAVLLDAPCTATGTIRRHPDIPWLKRPDDIVTLAALQSRLLDRAASLTAPGGILVFSTCSLEPEEGEMQVAPFLARRREFAPVPIAPAEIAGLAHLITEDGMLRTLPHQGFGAAQAAPGMDGFFAARFQRRTSDREA
jgi:16S rRNA (cytosine967-C5)-methyltransferase